MSAWFDWTDGSRLFYWRWGEWTKDARDGVRFCHLAKPERWFGRNYPAPPREAELKLRGKEDKLWYRRYITRGFIDLLVARFTVDKAGDDIRAVWDSRRNGHNATLWSPSFRMPTFRNLTNMAIKHLGVSLQDYLDGKAGPVLQRPPPI